MSEEAGTAHWLGEAGGKWRTALAILVGLLGAAVLIGLILSLRAADRERDRALALQAHSYEVMILGHALSETMASAEASLGRYVISGERAMGQLYSDQWGRAGAEIQRLKDITRQDSPQYARIGALEAAYQARSEELNRIAYHTSHKQNREAYAFFNAARNTKALRQVNDRLNALLTAERNTLETRSANADATIHQSTMIAKTLGVFGIFIILAAIILGWLMMRAVAERSIADAEADFERDRAYALEAAVTDATEKLRAEALERERAETRLRQMEKMEAVGQLTGGIAHDFNNMLAVVLGGLELAKRHLNDSRLARRHLDNATEGANRAAALTRRLLTFSRAEASAPEAVHGGSLIHGMADLLDRTLGDAITLNVENRSEDWRFWVDRYQLENAILNLAVNARDAMEGRGTLTIAADACSLDSDSVGECPAGDYVRLSVRDTGCGMTPDIAQRVFEPFFTTKPVGKGTGLGLSQIFGFVRQSGGGITIDSTPGQGTTVSLYLPRHLSEAVANENERELVRLAEPGITDPLDILVVEDDPRVLAATASVLEELGHRVVRCDAPLQAPAIVKMLPALDCVVSDVLMPEQTGPEMVAILKRDRPDLAVVFVTGYAGEGDDAMFDGHIVLRKPFTMAALGTAIAEASAGAGRADIARSA